MLEELLLEALGPAGIVLLIKIITDNKNRSLGEIKKFLADSGGHLADPGSVSWMFEEMVRTEIGLAQWRKNQTDLELTLIDAGANEFKEEEDRVIIYSSKEQADKIRALLEQNNIPAQAEIDYRPKNLLPIPADKTEKITGFLENIYALNDVDEIYSNAQF